jgi:hypothetical protein
VAEYRLDRQADCMAAGEAESERLLLDNPYQLIDTRALNTRGRCVCGELHPRFGVCRTSLEQGVDIRHGEHIMLRWRCAHEQRPWREWHPEQMDMGGGKGP